MLSAEMSGDSEDAPGLGCLSDLHWSWSLGF